MGYYIIFDHAIPNSKLLVDEKGVAKYFDNKEDAEDYLNINPDGQCAAIVEIVGTYDLD